MGSSLSRGVLRFTERLRNEDVNLYGFMLSVSGKQVAGAYCPLSGKGSRTASILSAKPSRASLSAC